MGRFLKERRPDILCLQETKCPNDKLPLKELQAFGYPFVVHMGQKGYNGVAILSRYPFAETERDGDVRPPGCPPHHRHLEPRGQGGGGARRSITSMCPPAATFPIRASTRNSATSSISWPRCAPGADKAKPTSQPAILVGDLNVAPLEHDVWSHKQLLDVVSHTPVETAALEELRQEAEWIDAMRVLRPEPEKIYSWWSYRSPDWAAADKGRRLDHIWLSKGMQDTIRSIDVTRDTRGWDRPSDHAPVTAVLEL